MATRKGDHAGRCERKRQADVDGGVHWHYFLEAGDARGGDVEAFVCAFGVEEAVEEEDVDGYGAELADEYPGVMET